MPSEVTKAVIPVAGFGTRFLPATKASPKEMLPLVDKPIVQVIVEELKASGIKEIIFVTSANKRAIEDHFDRSLELEDLLRKKGKKKELAAVKEIGAGVKFVYVRQGEPKGLGHAVLCAKEVVGNNPFMVCSGDDVIVGKVPAAKQMIEVYEKYHDPVLAVFKVKKEEVKRYGIIDPQAKIKADLFEIKNIVEKPEVAKAPSTLAATARWLLTPDVFDALEKTKTGAGGEIQLPDSLKNLLKVRPLYAKAIAGTYFDCGHKLEYLKAVVHFALKHPELKKDFAEFLKTR